MPLKGIAVGGDRICTDGSNTVRSVFPIKVIDVRTAVFLTGDGDFHHIAIAVRVILIGILEP